MKVLLTGQAGQLARAILETWSGFDLVTPEERNST